jgi:hypothetical protein
MRLATARKGHGAIDKIVQAVAPGTWHIGAFIEAGVQIGR